MTVTNVDLLSVLVNPYFDSVHVFFDSVHVLSQQGMSVILLAFNFQEVFEIYLTDFILV